MAAKNSQPALFLALLISASSACAQVYRWVDENGRVNYSNNPPPTATKAQVLDIDARPGPASPMEERVAPPAADEGSVMQPAAAAPPAPRGLDFRKYVSVQRGMSEGELVVIAGEADLLADQGLVRAAGRAAMALRTYTYLPTAADPFTTTITLVGGRVSEIERVRKF
jgi:Domain of unknown function (DUF4124)